MAEAPKSEGPQPEEGEVHTGGCLCGAVRYTVVGPMRPVIYCHCGQCRRWTGHFLAASAARRSQVTIEDPDGALKWYVSSPGYQRGFCSRCGTPLFWGRDGGGFYSIPAGSLDDDADLEAVMHVHTGSKGRYYDIHDKLPQNTDASSTTPEIEAWRDKSRAYR